MFLWAVALGSTAAPDLDVIYNTLFRGFVNHSTLWTHSLFLCLCLAGFWLILRYNGLWPFVRTAVGLAAFGWFSHLVLDVISHGTPLFYPFSMVFVGSPPARVVEGGFWMYITDPIFLLEPVLLSVMAVHWLWTRAWPVRLRQSLIASAICLLIVFVGSFIWWLPALQAFASIRMAN